MFGDVWNVLYIRMLNVPYKNIKEKIVFHNNNVWMNAIVEFIFEMIFDGIWVINVICECWSFYIKISDKNRNEYKMNWKWNGQ
jgi:hypothetical protein